MGASSGWKLFLGWLNGTKFHFIVFANGRRAQELPLGADKNQSKPELMRRAMEHLQLERLRKTYADGTQAVRDVSFGVGHKEAVFLLGPSGAGKTTTLRLVAGLEHADAGEIRIAGSDVTHRTPGARNVAMVYDKHSLFPHLSVKENLAYPLRVRKMSAADVDTRVAAVAQTLQISEQLEKMPSQLSAGQMQRVAIGRALVRDADVFLLDEPISHLDAQLRARMRVEFKRLQREYNATMLYVSHDQLEAMTMADRIVLINQGQVEQIDEPQKIFDRPETLFCATFIGEPAMNVLPAVLTGVGDGRTIAIEGTPIEVDRGWFEHGGPPLDPAERYLLGARPQHLSLAAPDSSAAGLVKGTVFAVEILGSRVVFHVEFGRSILRVLTSVDEARRHNSDIGAPIAVRFGPRHIYLFSQSTGRTVRQALFTETSPSSGRPAVPN